MIGQTEVLEAPGPRGLGHFLQGIVTIGEVGVAVEEAANVVAGDQDRELSCPGKGDLSPALPQLGFNEAQIECGVDVPLLGARQQTIAAVRRSAPLPAASFAWCSRSFVLSTAQSPRITSGTTFGSRILSASETPREFVNCNPAASRRALDLRQSILSSASS
jgi:hypothetical protein